MFIIINFITAHQTANKVGSLRVSLGLISRPKENVDSARIGAAGDDGADRDDEVVEYDGHDEHDGAVEAFGGDGAVGDVKTVNNDGGNEPSTSFVCTFPTLRTGKSLVYPILE